MIKKLLVIFLFLLIGFGGGILYVKLTENSKTANLSEIERYFLRQILLSTNNPIVDNNCGYLGKKDNISKDNIDESTI